MTAWPARAVIYEINTWVWLEDLRQKYRTPLTLATVPQAEWDAIEEWGVDAVWLMGVWERSPAGLAIANRNDGLVETFRLALPDYRSSDNVGSAYCVREYVVDANLGGRAGLAAARGELATRGIKLMLDFVPNHVAPDHPWVAEHPEYFVQGSVDDARNDPASFIEVMGNVFACGRDPYFPAWADVLQLNAFQPGLRDAVIETLGDIAGQCDGVRCDMAMLVINEIFERTWGTRAGPRPGTEYWVDVIAGVRERYPDFLLMAEAYWDREWELQQQGFDYCYDKRLYDRLEHEAAEGVRLHLCADLAYQDKLVRFIDNHDEPRAAAAFGSDKVRAAAVTMATVPGAKLFHEGQFEGRTVRPPVFLARRPHEPIDVPLQAFYRTLVRLSSSDLLRTGRWQVLVCEGWPDNRSWQDLVAWAWRNAHGFMVVVVNLSASRSQGRVRIPWGELAGRTWQMADVFNEVVYDRRGDELSADGLYVDLPAWGFHVLAS